MSVIKVTVDGAPRELENGSDGFGLFTDKTIVAQRVNGELRDLARPPPGHRRGLRRAQRPRRRPGAAPGLFIATTDQGDSSGDLIALEYPTAFLDQRAQAFFGVLTVEQFFCQ